MWSSSLRCTVVLVVNFVVHPDFNFSSIVSLRHFTMFGDQVAAIDRAVTRTGWQQFASVSLVLLLAYLVDAAARRWRIGGQGSRRQALAVTLGMTAPLLCDVGYDQLLAFGVLQAPVSNLPWLLGALMTMASVLGRDVVISRRALKQSVELQNQLARADRINIMGHLASSVAHELTQPLTANVLNATVGLECVQGDTSGAKELRTILGDIKGDSQRAAEVIARIQKFLKLEAIELHPLAVDKVLHDVVSLIGADGTCNGCIGSRYSAGVAECVG